MAAVLTTTRARRLRKLIINFAESVAEVGLMEAGVQPEDYRQVYDDRTIAWGTLTNYITHLVELEAK